MDSSFLTLVNVGLGLYATLLMIKMLIQFGLPNHPAKFTTYLVSFCATFFFGTKALVELGLVSPWFWMKWRTLPLVAGSVALLLQTIMTVGNFSLIQQKVVSRLPLIAALLCFAFFPSYAELFCGLAIAAGCIFLTVSVGKARYQKRLFLKMSLFLGLYALAQIPQVYALAILGQLLLGVSLFYFFIFENSIGVSALIDELRPVQGVSE
jgi:hypothetical protein